MLSEELEKAAELGRVVAEISEQADAKNCKNTNLLEFGVFGLGFFKGKKVGVGIFPHSQKILIGSAGFGGVALQRVSAG